MVHIQTVMEDNRIALRFIFQTCSMQTTLSILTIAKQDVCLKSMTKVRMSLSQITFLQILFIVSLMI